MSEPASSESAVATHRGWDRCLPLIFAICGGLAAASALGLVPSAWLPLCAAPLLAGGAAWPWILRWSPVQPSPWKLLVLSALLAPLGLAAVDGVLRWGLGMDLGSALAATYALAAVGQLLAWIPGSPRGCSRWRTTPAIAVSATFGLVIAGAVAALLFSGSAVRVSHHGLLHASILMGTERALPPENPWMGAEPLAYYWVWHAYAAHLGRALSLAPTQALALTNVWALAWMPLAFSFALAPIARCGKREVLGALGALLTLNAWGGWRWLFGASGASPTPQSPSELLAGLRTTLIPVVEGAPVFDPRLALGLSKFLNLSSYPCALGLLVAAWFATAHALRNGARPWVGLAALFYAACALINPLVGLPALAIALACALLFPGRPGLRVDLGLPLMLAAIPGGMWYVSASQHLTGAGVGLDLDPSRLLPAAIPVVLLWPLALIALLARLRSARDQRSVALFLGANALGFGLAAAWIALPYANEYKFVRLGALAAGSLAGLGLVDAWARGGLLRWSAAALALVVGGGALLGNYFGWQSYRYLAQFDLPLVEHERGLAPQPAERVPVQVSLAEMFALLRESSALRAERPLLMVDVLDPEGGAWWGTSLEGARPWKFTQANNLQGHEAAAFCGMDLFVDRPNQALLEGQRRRDLRISMLRALAEEVRLPVQLEGQLRAIERPLLMLVEPDQIERLARRVPRAPIDLERRLVQFGFGEVARTQQHALYAYPPDWVSTARAALQETSAP